MNSEPTFKVEQTKCRTHSSQCAKSWKTGCDSFAPKATSCASDGICLPIAATDGKVQSVHRGQLRSALTDWGRLDLGR